MDNSVAIGGPGLWFASWLFSLALAAIAGRLLAPLPDQAAGALFERVMVRGGAVSFARTSAVAVILTAITALVLVGQLLRGGFVRTADIRFGALVLLVITGLVLMLVPHYLVCRWLRGPLRAQPAAAAAWLRDRLLVPAAVVAGAVIAAFAFVLAVGTITGLGSFFIGPSGPFPGVPNLFIYPDQEALGDSARGAILLSFFAVYPLGLQAAWPLAALLTDGAKGAAAFTGAMTRALMALATALHLLLLPTFW